MNARAHSFVTALRGILATVPGATAIGLHAIGAWAYVHIAAANDEAVRELGAGLGLGAPETRTHEGRWWLRATSERELELRIEVVGPHHNGPAPGEESAP